MSIPHNDMGWEEEHKLRMACILNGFFGGLVPIPNFGLPVAEQQLGRGYYSRTV